MAAAGGQAASSRASRGLSVATAAAAGLRMDTAHARGDATRCRDDAELREAPPSAPRPVSSERWLEVVKTVPGHEAAVCIGLT